MRPEILALTATTVAVACALSHQKQEVTKKKKRSRQPRYLRPALLSPLSSDGKTPWRQLFSCGSSSDFIITLNVDRHIIFNFLLPKFEAARATVNFGSPFRMAPKNGDGDQRCPALTYSGWLYGS